MAGVFGVGAREKENFLHGHGVQGGGGNPAVQQPRQGFGAPVAVGQPENGEPDQFIDDVDRLFPQRIEGIGRGMNGCP
ncbi:hypothetical protein JCM14719A_13610 [Calditerricola satsumensis]|uniref:Uncharacterized protein n=1 Tax=Calditerricola satsumensis TaxID=373054 RepID=A0A8J3B425_9BACI|nr:hypothetical protein GCM10007043_05060 [Calditerricola satsumensis]